MNQVKSLVTIFLLTLLAVEGQGAGVNLTANVTMDIFNSPNHPHNYDPNLNCVWIITAAEGCTAVEVTFTNFSIEANFDSVKIRDGGLESSDLIANITVPLDVLPKTVTSTATQIWIQFESDGSYELPGFKANYRATNCTSQAECNRTIDLGFLLDGSGSIGAVNFQKILDFTKSLIEKFPVSVSMTHVGVVVYGQSATVSFDFNTYSDKQTMITAVENIQYPHAPDTKTGNGLSVTRNDLFQATGRTGVEQYLVVVTDGQSSDDVVAPSNQLKGDGVTIFSVGVGSSFNLNELNTISSDPDSVYTLPLNSSDSLTSIVTTIKNEICNNWGHWGHWSECSECCGNGTQTRMRNCTYPPCVGEPTESRECNTHPCTVCNGTQFIQHFPHETECEWFYQCDNFTLTCHKCGLDNGIQMWFDAKRVICNLPCAVNCTDGVGRPADV